MVPLLRAAGHRVLGIDVEEERQSDICMRHDLTTSFTGTIGSAGVCVHLASVVGGIVLNTHAQEIVPANEAINAHTLELCRRMGCTRMIFTSSVNVFETTGCFLHGPLRQLDQTTPYAVSKALGERQIEGSGLDFLVVRPTNLYGRAQGRVSTQYGESHVIPDLLEKILRDDVVEVMGDGTQRRNFVHVSDVARFVVGSLGTSGTHYLNLRSDNTVTIAGLVELLMEFTGVRKPVKFLPEFMRLERLRIEAFDMQIPRALGWEPRIGSLKEGLAK